MPTTVPAVVPSPEPSRPVAKAKSAAPRFFQQWRPRLLRRAQRGALAAASPQRPLLTTAAVLLLLSLLSSRGQGTKADYERSANLNQRFANKVLKQRVTPHWLADTNRFWYRNDLADGKREFILVNASQATRSLAFDHAKLAAALTKAARGGGRPQEPAREVLHAHDVSVSLGRQAPRRPRAELHSG